MNQRGLPRSVPSGPVSLRRLSTVLLAALAVVERGICFLFSSQGPLTSARRRPPSTLRPIFPLSSAAGDEGGESLTDADISSLLKQVSSLRESRAEEDRNQARNWKMGLFRAVELVESDSNIAPVRLCGDLLAFGTEAGGIYVIEMSTGDLACAWTGHDGPISALSFRGDMAISGGIDGVIMAHKFRILSAKSLGLGEDEEVAEMTSAVGVNEGDEDGGESEALAVSPLVEDLLIQEAHSGCITGLARTDKNSFVSSCIDGSMKMWNLETGEEVWTHMKPSPITCLEASDGYIVTGHQDGILRIHEAGGGREIMAFPAHTGGVRCIHFPHQGRLLTGGQDGLVKYWDLEEGGKPVDGTYNVDGREILHCFSGHESPIMALQGDETKVVSIAKDGVLRVNDIRNGLELFRIEGYSPQATSVQFSERYLATDGTYMTLVCHDFSGTEFDTGE